MIRPRYWMTIVVALSLSACVGDEQTHNANVSQSARGFDYQGMMANYADAVFVPEYQAFAEQAEALAEGLNSVQFYCEALERSETPATIERVRNQWLRTMEQWQKIELFQVGPLVANGGALRNRIYSFGSSAPLSECAVDQSVVLAQEEGFDLSSRSVNARGLDALEYLLFSEELTHHCPSQISETDGWNEQSEHSRRQQRCDYAQRLADDVVEASQVLVNAWQPEGGDYRFEWVNPANQEDNLKALSDALFYIELDTKDRKLGVPTGLHNDCNAVACPEVVESPYSESSMANIAANLDGFITLYTGASGLGFDDLIVHEGFPDIASDIRELALDAAVRAQLNGPSLYEQTSEQLAAGSAEQCHNWAANPESAEGFEACAVHGYMKRVTDRLRTDFVTIVDLDLPERGQSDND